MIDFDVITGPNPSEAAEKPARDKPPTVPVQPASSASEPARLAPPMPADTKA